NEELKNYENATASIVLSEEGQIVGKFFSENRTNVFYQQIPPYLIDALIATEDARFYDHKGIDIRSLFRVLIKTVLLGDDSAGGGSTISQQLAKNIFGRENFGLFTLPVNKIKEGLMARRLENTFSKDEILTLYLNTVSFGENVYGIEAASRRYFNKPVENLKIEEATLLVGMLKANTYYNPRLYPENAKIRRNVVLSQMEKYEYMESAKADSLQLLSIDLDYSDPELERLSGYFMDQVKKEAEQVLESINSDSESGWNLEEDGLIINTTLNYSLQNYATKSFHDHLSVMQERLTRQYESVAGKRILAQVAAREIERLNLSLRTNDVRLQRIFDWKGSYSDSISVMDSLERALTLLHAGLIAVDPKTGAVKAWVGGIDYISQPYDQVLARRQLASTFKPVLFAAALEEGIEPCHYLDNDSIILAGYEDWSPANYDNTYGGKYSLTGSLVKSMNIPSFNLFLDIEFDRLDFLWKKMGFSFDLKNSPSLALGTAEANLKEAAIAYSAFANGGFKINPKSVVSITTAGGEILYENDFKEIHDRVLSESSSLLISEMLQKAISEGTGISLRSTYGVTLPIAGKTGTSQDYGDAWFAAFNPEIVIISRVGASSQAIHFNQGSNGSGSALALPLVALTLKQAQQNPELSKQLFSPFPELSPSLTELLDCPDYKEKTVFDFFIDMFKTDGVTFDLKKDVDDDGDDEADKEDDEGDEEGEKKKRSFFRRLFRRN
ncbi:MAG: transglycosylase domain-containing protein, partial [Ignavibacteriaceae bacterium]